MGEMGSWEDEALDPIEAREGVEADVVEKVDIGREGIPEGLVSSAGMSSTSKESR